MFKASDARSTLLHDVPKVFHLNMSKSFREHPEESGIPCMPRSLGGSRLAASDADGDAQDVDFLGCHALSIP